MPPQTPDERTVNLAASSLSSAAVDDLARQISTLDLANGSAIVIDCHKVRSVLPDGLAALLALRARHEQARWVLVSTPRAVLATLLEAALADRFWVCSDANAAKRALREEPS